MAFCRQWKIGKLELFGSMPNDPLACNYTDALRGSDLILSFMSVAELRMGAISAGWGSNRWLLLDRFIHGFELFYADNNLCTLWARIRADARVAGRPGSRETIPSSG